MAIDVYKEWLGIPEGPRPPDHYQLLRLVQFEDHVDKIRKNYKKLNGHVRKYATGQYSDQSQLLLNELAKAMLCLTDEELKQEYDRSLGRVIDDRDESGRRPMTSYLQDEGAITSDQAKEAKTHAERTGLSVRDAIVQLKMVDQETAARAFANEIGRSYVDLADLVPENDVLDQVPKNVVRRQNCLPLFTDENSVVVACADEPDSELEDEIRLRFGKPIRPVIASGKAINQAIAIHYAAGMRKEVAEPAKGTGKSSAKTSAQKATAAAKQAAPELSEGEKAERKQLGLIFMCWAIVVPALLDTFVLWDRVYRYVLPRFMEWFPYLCTIFIGLPLAFLIYQTHVKPKR
jgi:curved DNA-binding protein CbpA